MRRFLILALVVCLCGAIATSCSDDILKTDEPVAENVWFEIELDKTYGLMDFVENTLLPQAEGSLDNITMQLVKAQLAMMEQTITKRLPKSGCKIINRKANSIIPTGIT